MLLMLLMANFVKILCLGMRVNVIVRYKNLQDTTSLDCIKIAFATSKSLLVCHNLATSKSL